MVDDVLTEEGVRFLEDIADQYREHPQDEVNDRFGVSAYDHNLVIDLPDDHENYGSLLTDGSQDYVAKFSSHDPMEPYIAYEEEGRPHLSHEKFGELRAWLEAQNRGDEDLFAPIVAWEARDLSWLVMEEIDAIEHGMPIHDEMKPVYEERGWDPYDMDVGYRGEELVAYDYGDVSPTDGWTVDEADVIQADESYWPDVRSVPLREPDYQLTVDTPELREELVDRLPHDMRFPRRFGSDDLGRAITLTDTVDEWLSERLNPAEQRLRLSTAIEAGVRDPKTLSAAFTTTATFCGLPSVYMEGRKQPRRPDEDVMNHSWVMTKIGGEEHLIDIDLKIFGRYDPMRRGHGYEEEERHDIGIHPGEERERNPVDWARDVVRDKLGTRYKTI